MSRDDCFTKKKLIENIIIIWYHDDEIKNISAKLVSKHKGGHADY